MRKADEKKIWWAMTIYYIALTYGALGVMPSAWRWFNNLLGGKGVIALYIGYSLAGLLLLLYIVFVKKEKSLERYLLLFVLTGVFFLMVKMEKNPGEKIHMAQYWILGGLLYKALRQTYGRFDKRLYLYGSAISLLAGAIDEILQVVLPNRVFTWHDLFINGSSGIIALLVIRFNILKEEKIKTSARPLDTPGPS